MALRYSTAAVISYGGRRRAGSRGGGRSGRPRFAPVRVAVVVASVVAGAPGLARAAAPVNGLPYAFAYRLGSGIYTAGGRTIQIYSFGLSHALREVSPEQPWGLRLKFPLTLGFFDFKFEDILETGLPKHASTISLVPGVEFPHRMRDHWTLAPYGEAGIAHQTDEGKATYIGAVGLKSLVDIPQLSGYWLFNVDLYFAEDFPEEGERGGYSALDLGLDRRWPTGLHLGRNELEFGLFGVQYFYWLDEEIVQTADSPSGPGVQWELGVTLGTVRPVRVIGLRMPRIGLSYRFGEGGGEIRFVLGDPL